MSLLTVSGVTKTFSPSGRRAVRAVDDVSLDVAEGRTLGLVGESGCGKSTLLRCILRLERPEKGQVLYDGLDIYRARGADLRRFRREVQLVFQDPYASLNPRMTVEELVGEGMLIHRLERNRAKRKDRVAELLSMVGLDAAQMGRYPRTFSGGQRQRIAIARALAVKPRVLACDEPVSALDVSVQAQVINLLIDTQATLGLTLLFVAHNMAVIRHLCPEIAVMHRGRIVERDRREQIFGQPADPYTQSLLAAVPVPDPRLRTARDSVIPEPPGALAGSDPAEDHT